MTNNPLIAKWEELNKKKEEPKPVSKPYTRHNSTIATLEALLEDLKSGRAIMTDCRTDDNYNHLDLPIPCSSLPSSEFIMNSYLSVERGQRIALEIFRKYD